MWVELGDHPNEKKTEEHFSGSDTYGKQFCFSKLFGICDTKEKPAFRARLLRLPLIFANLSVLAKLQAFFQA